MVIGDDDPFLPYASKGADRVRAAGATVRMETLPGVAHHFPTDFDSLVGQRLERLAHSDR